jgi:hypothetical protein
MNKLEFRDNEEYPRFNGVLMTPKECIKLYGFDGEFDILKKDIISLNGIIYTNKKLYDVIKLLGEVHDEVEEYDVISSQGRGFSTYCAEERLNNTVVIPLRVIEYLEAIKPFNDFKKDHPNINIEKYKEFYGCLNEYFAIKYNVTYSDYN